MTMVLSRLAARTRRLIATLARDTGANVIMIVAASLFPLLALVGSGIDMGRGYMAETRLQQACDAGTLAARKRMGTSAAAGGRIPAAVADSGQRFFNINFRDGAYGSTNRRFVMTLHDDYTVSGTASADIDTTIMGAFGYQVIPVSVECSAQITMANTDIMMVLDTTGSMSNINLGDIKPRIQALRDTVRSFHAQMEANKAAGTRIRYGFVPYSTNVNVGHLLRPEWMVDDWEYNFRRSRSTGGTVEEPVIESNYTYISGSVTPVAQYQSSTCPASTDSRVTLSETTTPDGWTHQQIQESGTRYECRQTDTDTFEVTGTVYDDHVFNWESHQTGIRIVEAANWQYRKFPVNLDFLDSSNSMSVPMGGTALLPLPVEVSYRGCVEERDTYEINDYSNVDLRRALDLDIDRVPDGSDATRWRPMLNELSYVREVRTNGTGVFSPTTVNSPLEFINSWWWGFGACPAPARNLQEMNAQQVSDYVDTLIPQGSTYHDIGMIWGGRLLSPTGLFATANADLNGVHTSRHMIFMTDGETAPLDVSYGPYGIEPLDRRRWKPNSGRTLTQTVEARFAFACAEVRRRNIQVWVVSFGTAANPVMQNCAGADRYFVANDAAELEASFSEIARRMAGLRLVR